MPQLDALLLGRDPSMHFYGDLWHVSPRLALLAILIVAVTLVAAFGRRR